MGGCVDIRGLVVIHQIVQYVLTGLLAFTGAVVGALLTRRSAKEQLAQAQEQFDAENRSKSVNEAIERLNSPSSAEREAGLAVLRAVLTFDTTEKEAGRPPFLPPLVLAAALAALSEHVKQPAAEIEQSEGRSLAVWGVRWKLPGPRKEGGS